MTGAVGVQYWQPNSPLRAMDADEASAVTPGFVSLHELGFAQTALLVHRGSSSAHIYAGLVDTVRTEIGGPEIVYRGGLFKRIPKIATQSRPAIARIGRTIHMIYQGDGTHALYDSILDLTNVDITAGMNVGSGHASDWYWQNWRESKLALSSVVSPDVVYDQMTDRLYLVYADSNNELCTSSSDGGIWSAPIRRSVPGDPIVGISATVFGGQLLVLLTLSSDEFGCYMGLVGLSLPPTDKFESRLAPPRGSTERGPIGMAVHDGYLQVMRRLGSNLWWNALNLETNVWGVDSAVPSQSSATQPVLGMIGPQLVLFHTAHNKTIWGSRYSETP